MSEVTLRKAASQVRRALKDHTCKVTARTVSFEGFGFDACGFITCACEKPLTPELRQILEDLDRTYKQAVPKARIIIELRGPAYPFGGTIKCSSSS